MLEMIRAQVTNTETTVLLVQDNLRMLLRQIELLNTPPLPGLSESADSAQRAADSAGCCIHCRTANTCPSPAESAGSHRGPLADSANVDYANRAGSRASHPDSQCTACRCGNCTDTCVDTTATSPIAVHRDWTEGVVRRAADLYPLVAQLCNAPGGPKTNAAIRAVENSLLHTLHCIHTVYGYPYELQQFRDTVTAAVNAKEPTR